MNLHNMKLESVYAKGEDGEFHLVARRDECETKATAEKEYIEREKLPLEIPAYGLSDRAVAFATGYNTCLKDVKSIPAADVRPVVCCRYCDMYECHEYDGGLKYVCRLFKRQMQEADFCSYGVKREES